MQVVIKVDDKRIKAALKDAALIKGPVATFLKKSAFTIEGRAKELAPVDTGRLRSGVQTKLGPFRAVVAATVFYSPYVEFGTRPHFPPVEALRGWARRHRQNPWAVAMAIAKRGTRAQPFMRPGAEQSMPIIRGYLEEAAREIESRFHRGIGS